MRFYGQKHPIAAEYRDFPVPLERIRPLDAARAAEGYAALKDPANIEALGQAEKAHPNAVCYYSPPFLADLFGLIGAHIRPLLAYDIVETYYYARLYGTGDQLGLHTDRGGCFVSVSVCLGYDFSPLFPEGSAWPIGVLAEEADGAGRPVTFGLAPGEGVLYPGCAIPHWRDVFLGAHCGQAFFHWVPAEPGRFGAFYGDPDKQG